MATRFNVVAAFPDKKKAERAVQRLEQTGVLKSNVHVLRPGLNHDPDRVAELRAEMQDEVAEGFGGSRIPRLAPLYVKEPVITEWHQIHRDLFAVQYPRLFNGPLNLLERLTARGLLDDRRFATQYAAVRLARGRGPARLLVDLLAQGVDRRLADEAVRRALEDEAVDPEIEMRAVAVKRARQLAHLPPVVRKRRLLAYLVRRGYGGPGAKHLVHEVCNS